MIENRRKKAAILYEPCEQIFVVIFNAALYDNFWRQYFNKGERVKIQVCLNLAIKSSLSFHCHCSMKMFCRKPTDEGIVLFIISNCFYQNTYLRTKGTDEIRHSILLMPPATVYNYISIEKVLFLPPCDTNIRY